MGILSIWSVSPLRVCQLLCNRYYREFSEFSLHIFVAAEYRLAKRHWAIYRHAVTSCLHCNQIIRHLVLNHFLKSIRFHDLLKTQVAAKLYNSFLQEFAEIVLFYWRFTVDDTYSFKCPVERWQHLPFNTNKIFYF